MSDSFKFQLTDKHFLMGYLLLTPIIIWTITFIWACCRVYRNDHRDQMAEDRKRWMAQHQAPKRTIRRRIKKNS